MTWAKTICLDDFLEAVKVSSIKESDSLGKPLEAPSQEELVSTADELAKTQEELRKHVGTLIAKIDKDCQELLEAMQSQIPSLVIKLLRKVLGTYEMDTKVLHSVINDALKEVSEDNAYVEVFISQEDWDALQADDTNWTHSYPKVSFFRDEKLKVGDCLVKSRFGLIDARLEQKLLKIEKELAVL